jgi:hypothetical protein
LAANQGTSAVNCIETVVSVITKKHGLDPTRTIFLHHCSAGEGIEFGKEDFHRFIVQWNGANLEKNTSGKWSKLTRHQVEQLIETPFQN